MRILGAIGSDWRQECKGCDSPGICTDCKHCVPKWLCLSALDENDEGNFTTLTWSCAAPVDHDFNGHYSGVLSCTDEEIDILAYFKKEAGECTMLLESVALGFTQESPGVLTRVCESEGVEYYTLDVEIAVCGTTRIEIRHPGVTNIYKQCGEGCLLCRCVCSTLCVIYSHGTGVLVEVANWSCETRSWIGNTVEVFLEGSGDACSVRAEIISEGASFDSAYTLLTQSECTALYAHFNRDVGGFIETLTIFCNKCSSGCGYVSTPCCDAALPQVVFAVIEFPTLGLPCDPIADLVVPLVWDPVFIGWRWAGVLFRNCERPDEDPPGVPQDDCEWEFLAMDLTCDSMGTATLDINGTQYVATTFVCDPLEFEFTNVDFRTLGDSGCGELTITILETAP